MKLADYTGWLLASVQDDGTTAAELLRALREQSIHFDADKAPAGTELRPDILKARSGPGGGLDADPFLAGFVLIAVMLGGKRADLGNRVWHTWHLHHESMPRVAWGEEELYRQLRESKGCQLTGQHLFGDALKQILGNEDLARQIGRLRITGDLVAEIEDDAGKVVSRFKSLRPPPPLRRPAELDGMIIAGIGAILARH
jgi:hypothetical protein